MCHTFAGRLDADWLESSVEGRGIDDVRVEVPVVLPVDEERHDDRDNQTHDHGYDYTHIQGYIVCAGGHWRVGGRQNTERKTVFFRANKLISITLRFLCQYAGVVMKPLSAD